MSCRRTDDRIFEIVRANVDEIVLVSDEAMEEAARWLWFEMGVARIFPARRRWRRCVRTCRRSPARSIPKARSDAGQSRVTAIAWISMRRSSKAKRVT
jgi:hypothetical protein